MGHQSDSTIITYKERGISMSKKKVVVSLGHDALGYTIMEQWDAVKDTAKALADLVEADYQLTITHSNGPQVSMIHKAMTELRRIYIDYTPAPMCVCSAMSQGYVGYDIQNSLKAELMSRGITKPVSTILTQVTVDPYDPHTCRCRSDRYRLRWWRYSGHRTAARLSGCFRRYRKGLHCRKACIRSVGR